MVRSKESLESEYRSITHKSLAQWNRGKPVMPGGVIKGAYWSSPYPLYADRAEGCYLWDLDGNRYVDFANHHTAMILGHNHPAVVEAVRKEIDRGFGLGVPTAIEAEIAEEITGRIRSVEKVRFTNSGTESSLHATRLVRAVTGKPKVAKFEGAYHGSHDALEISVAPSVDQAGPYDSPVALAAWEGMARGSEEDVIVLPYNQMESVELILREHHNELAAIFYDGKPGMMEVPDEFTHFLRELCSELGILMVMDEVVSFRVGYSGYQGICGVDPDLTLFGKILGGGLPVGALGGKAEFMDVLDNTQGRTKLGQSGTFSGNNFTVAAGLATLRSLTPEVYKHLDELRERLRNGLVDTFEHANIPCQVLSAGSIVNAFPSDQPVTDHRSFMAVDSELMERIFMGLLLRGYHMGQGSMGMLLSSPMTVDHIDGLLEAVGEVLAEQDD